MNEQAYAARRAQAMRSAARYGPPVALMLSLIVLWQLATALWDIEAWLLPSPLAIARAAIEARGLLWGHVWETVKETIVGFAIALAVGWTLGVLIDLSPTVRSALYPVLVVSQTIPTIAIAPLLVIWFGYGILPKLIVVALICFFPVVINTADGLRSADPDLVALLRTMGASRRDVFLKVRLPGALPSIIGGVKIAITYSVVGAIMGEWVGASRGLGIFMLRATNSFRTDWVFVSIGITALLSVLLFSLVGLVERWALPWYTAAGRDQRWEEI